MSKLISGKEALIALANGEDVEYFDARDNFKKLGWGSALGLATNLFFGENHLKFRLKPRTIKIEIEVPEPFVPKEGDTVYFIDCETDRGYSCGDLNSESEKHWFQFGTWRSESEIKQVVKALRQAFNK